MQWHVLNKLLANLLEVGHVLLAKCSEQMSVDNVKLLPVVRKVAEL